MSGRDPVRAREAQRRFRHKKKVEKYGPELADVDMRGKHSNHVKGPNHPRWNELGRLMAENGYVRVRVGINHPLADPNGYAYEHLLIWCAAGKPMPSANQIIHHRNEDKTDNRLENLELMTRPVHSAHHIANRKRDRAGRLLDGYEYNDFPEEAQ